MENKPKAQRVPVGDRIVIYPRGNKGIYTADFHHGGHVRVSLKTRNLKEARRRAVGLEHDIAQRTWRKAPRGSASEKPTAIGEAIERFEVFVATEGLRPKTRTKYRGILAQFLAFAGGRGVTRLAAVDLRLVDQYRAERKLHLSPKSMHHEGSLLKRFLGWCLERKLIPENPLASWKFTPPKPKKYHPLTLEQVNAILATASAMRRPVLAVLGFTGMRSGECQHLLVEDVDLHGGWIHIRHRPNAPTKTGEDWKVPLHPRLAEILRALPKSKGPWFFTAQPSAKFPEGQHHINTKHLNEDFQKILRKLHLPTGRKSGGFTIHSLRHFFKTFAINARIPKPVVDQWQGHDLRKNPSDLYYTLSDAESQRFMSEVPFGTGKPAADAGEKEN